MAASVIVPAFWRIMSECHSAVGWSIGRKDLDCLLPFLDSFFETGTIHDLLLSQCLSSDVVLTAQFGSISPGTPLATCESLELGDSS